MSDLELQTVKEEVNNLRSLKHNAQLNVGNSGMNRNFYHGSEY